MSWLYGVHAVEAAMAADPSSIDEVWFARSRKPGAARERLRTAVEVAGLRYRLVEEAQLARAVGDVVHQGVAARVAEFRYAESSELFAAPGIPSVVVVLDEVQDPHNLGAVIRTAAAFGADGVVIPRHRAASVTGAVRKVAVGAEQRVRVAQVVNVARFIEEAKTAGYWAYAASAAGAEASWGLSFPARVALVFGSEGRGVRPLVRARCDGEVAVRIARVESLNVSSSAVALLYEWRRQHRAGDENG